MLIFLLKKLAAIDNKNLLFQLFKSFVLTDYQRVLTETNHGVKFASVLRLVRHRSRQLLHRNAFCKENSKLKIRKEWKFSVTGVRDGFTGIYRLEVARM